MTPEKQEYLFNTYPIFDRTHERFRTGFNCEDGWFQFLIDVGFTLTTFGFRDLKVVGVKQKFGRAVIEAEHDDKGSASLIDGILDAFYEGSAFICERCGAEKEATEDHCKPMNPTHKLCAG